VILSGHTGTGWESGRFGIERKCDCRKGQRSAECYTAGWHLVASSDDRGDALCCARELSSITAHRVVDQRNYETIGTHHMVAA
jgi:hypothetical protein